MCIYWELSPGPHACALPISYTLSPRISFVVWIMLKCALHLFSFLIYSV
jgi:hypothetical protein